MFHSFGTVQSSTCVPVGTSVRRSGAGRSRSMRSSVAADAVAGDAAADRKEVLDQRPHRIRHRRPRTAQSSITNTPAAAARRIAPRESRQRFAVTSPGSATSLRSSRQGVAGKARPSTESERTRRCVSAERRARRPQRRPGATAQFPPDSSKRLQKEPLRCCPGEGIRRNGRFCRAPRASITSAAPTTLTLPTHDLVAGAAWPLFAAHPHANPVRFRNPRVLTHGAM